MFILQENVLWHEQDRPHLNAIFNVEKVEMKTDTLGKPLETGYPKKLTTKTYEDLVHIMSTIQQNLEKGYEIQRELEKYVSQSILSFFFVDYRHKLKYFFRMSYRIVKEVRSNPANKSQDHWTSEDINIALDEKLIEEELGTGDILSSLIHLDEVKSRFIFNI